MEHTITELARKRSCRENLAKSGKEVEFPEFKLLQKLVFFLASKPNCISHTIPDFSRAVNRGLRAMIDEALERRAGGGG